jgi:uncharacterized repeat protein (TIGR01451 family)
MVGRMNWQRLASGIGVVFLIALSLALFPSVLHGRAAMDTEILNAASFTLSGRVYEGTTGQEPPNSAPLQNVKVELWCSNGQYPSQGTLVDTQYTNDQGWYGLTMERDACEFYHIIETNPSGYVSDGATSVGGEVKTDDWIQYTYGLAGKVLTGNKFWDKSTTTKTPTPTPRASSTRTPTLTRTPTRTGSPTPTGTPYADLRIYKVLYAPTGTVVPGATITYQLCTGSQEWINTSESPRIVVTDTLPSKVSFISAFGSAATCSLIASRPPSDIVRCESDFTGSGSFCVYLDVRVDNDACGLLHNHAEARAKVFDPDLSNNTVDLYTQVGTCVTPSPTPTRTRTPTRGPTVSPTATSRVTSTATHTPGGPADIRISKTLNAISPVAPGSAITYTLSVTNTGPGVARGVVVTDTLPMFPLGIQCECQEPNCLGGVGPVPPDGDPSRILWQVGDLPSGASRTAKVLCNVLAGACGPALNEAYVTSDTEDPNPANNHAEAMVEIGPCEGADLEITKFSDLAGSVKPGGTIGYSVWLTNNGPSLVSTIVVSDVIPPGLTISWLYSACVMVPQGSATVVRCEYSGLPPNIWVHATLFRATVDAEACGPIVNTVTVSSDTPDPDLSNNTSQLVTMVEPCPPANIRVVKTLVDPPGGVANVGDIVRFRIDVHNTSQMPTVVDLEDTFLDAEFDFVLSFPPPTANTSDGTNHFLLWENLPVPPVGVTTVMVDLKTKIPGASTDNCAHYIPPEQAGAVQAAGPLSCAAVQVRALEGRHFTLTKTFMVPSNHVAQVGDNLQFWIRFWNTGTEPVTAYTFYDYFVPPAVAPFYPRSHSMSKPIPPGGGWLWIMPMVPAVTASPAVNTVDWTVTWPDGTKETKSATDYVYITDGQAGKGLFINKELLAPLGGAVVSDTVAFRITVTNVTGADLAVVPLSDTFDLPCLRFDHASIPPDSVGAGTLTWNNIGPLPIGAHGSVEVFFHADAVCPAAMNCAGTQVQSPAGQPMYSVDCANIAIRGPQPHLIVRKRLVSPNPALVGSLVIWEIAVTNDGSGALPVVPLHDGYQVMYFDFDSATPGPNTIDLINGRLDWNNIGPLAPSQTKTVLLRLIAKKPHLGALNCAESRYTVGSSSLMPSDCATVDILTEWPSISIQKERTGPDPTAAVAVGDTVAFKITIRNTGMTPLNNVVVQDFYDSDCLEFVNAPGMATYLGPGSLRWEFPGPSALNVGDSLSWDVIFRVKAPCNPIPNCAAADGSDPDGAPVHDETCVEITATMPEPGLSITKRLAAPEAMPGVGKVMRFEIVVQNTGNSTLGIVPVDDNWDADCLMFVTANPSPDFLNEAAGHIHWNNVGPLPPGGSAVLSVFFGGKALCEQTGNCARAWWEEGGVVRLDAMDCAEFAIGAGMRKVYLPIVMKQYLVPGPTHTPTRTATRTRTTTATRTPSATLSAGTSTLTRTRTPTATPSAATSTPTPLAGAAIFSDNFNDGDLAGWTSSGGTWTNPGTYMRGSRSDGYAWNMRAETGSNVIYEGTVNLLSGKGAGLVARASSDGTSSYCAVLDAADNAFRLCIDHEGWYMHSYQMTVEYNHQYRIKFVLNGNWFNVYLDGVKRLTGSYNRYDSGQFGVMVWDGEAAFDNLEARSAP